MIVMKFGGTSVGSSAMIREVASIVKASKGRRPVVVVSAVAKITDLLLQAAENAAKGDYSQYVSSIMQKHSQIISELGLDSGIVDAEHGKLEERLMQIASAGSLSKKDADYVASFGERISAKIVAEHGRNEGMDTVSHNAYELGMVTDSNFGSAEILDETYSSIAKSISSLPKGQIPIITGFIGMTGNSEITTLGRGGSDYSAAIIGAAISAEEVQIWTDVDGVMTADPRIVKDARIIPTVTFDEASELAYFGAKVLHPKTIIPVMDKNIPVRVLNTYNPRGNGTTIVAGAGGRELGKITSIASKKNISIININSARMFMMHGFLHKIFKIFDEHNAPVDMISTSEVNVSVTVDSKANADLKEVIEDLRGMAKVSIEGNKASVSVVGSAIKRTPGISGIILSALGSDNINVEMISQGASEINIGMVVNEEDAENAVRILHKTFFGGASE